MNNVTYEEALDILLNIPKEEFGVGSYLDRDGKRCSLGHLSHIVLNRPYLSPYLVNNIDLDKKEVYCTPGGCSLISNINDSPGTEPYSQFYPKYRVLSYLLDIVKAGFGNTLVFHDNSLKFRFK
jgi:hypothetical protein